MALVEATYAPDGRTVSVPRGWVKLWPHVYVVPVITPESKPASQPKTETAKPASEPKPDPAEASTESKEEA